MTTSGQPAYDNLAGHPFGVNAKSLLTNKQTDCPAYDIYASCEDLFSNDPGIRILWCYSAILYSTLAVCGYFINNPVSFNL